MAMPPDLDISSSDGLYPIRHVCAETGINPVTLRAWERRYGLIQPVRTPKGHRLYSAEDIGKIQRILSLIEEGVAVSQVGRLFTAPEVLESVQGPGRGPDHNADRNADPRPTPHATPTHNAGDINGGDINTRDINTWDIAESPREYLAEENRENAATGASAARRKEVIPGGLPPLITDPISGALIAAAGAFNAAHLERTYARLLMRHGWDGVHDLAFVSAYQHLRSESQHNPAAEARLAVFAAWATASLSEQLRSALLLCEGPTCPCITLGHGHRRLEGLLFQLASARQGLRVLPLLDAPSAPGLRLCTDALNAPAVAFYLPSFAAPPLEAERLRELLLQAVTPCYLAGPGARGWLGLAAPQPLIALPERPVPAADTLSRMLLGGSHD